MASYLLNPKFHYKALDDENHRIDFIISIFPFLPPLVEETEAYFYWKRETQQE